MSAVDKAFAYHDPSANATEKIRTLRAAYSELKYRIEAELPAASRERSIAFTELETSAMWAIKAVVHNDPESVVST